MEDCSEQAGGGLLRASRWRIAQNKQEEVEDCLERAGGGGGLLKVNRRESEPKVEIKKIL